MFKIPVQNGIWEIDAPQVMGILNVTSDSFYAGSRAKSVESAVKKVNQFITEGATIIDIGGQSTRPGAKLLSIQEEIENVVPIVEGIRNQHPNILLSIDTFHSQVAAAAFILGAFLSFIFVSGFLGLPRFPLGLISTVGFSFF